MMIMMMIMTMLIIMMMMTWARDLDRAPLRGGDRGGRGPAVAATRDLDQRSIQCCVAVDTLHLSVEQREPVHRVVAGRAPPNLSNH